MPEYHYPFAASSMSRVMACPASAIVAAEAPRSQAAIESADYGTRLHAVAERAIANETDEYKKRLPKEDADLVEPYVEYVRSLKASTLLLEQRVEVHPLCGGTADCLAVQTRGRLSRLVVADYKTGKWPVDPRENWQLITYGYGAAVSRGGPFSGFDFDFARLAIIQPRAYSEPKTWDVSRGDLARLGLDVVARVEAIVSGDAEFVPGEEQCKFCPGRLECPAHAAAAVDAARRAFGVGPKTKETRRVRKLADRPARELNLSEKLAVARLARSWCSVVETEARRAMIEDGATVAGWKVVEGRPRREWDGDRGMKGAKRFLERCGFDETEIYTDPVLKSPKQAEKLFKGKGSGEKKKELAEFVRSKPGAPSIAEASDPRPEFNRASAARRDFAEWLE